MSRYANQKQIIVKRVNKKLRNNFISIALSSLDKAGVALSGNAFKLYTYIAGNKDNYSFYLSSMDVMKKRGMSRSGYFSAVNELQDKGYLVQPDETVNNYIFYEDPNLIQKEDEPHNEKICDILSQLSIEEKIELEKLAEKEILKHSCNKQKEVKP